MQERAHTAMVLEMELLTPACRGNRRRVSELLHDDFVEHGASGRIWTKQQVLDDLEQNPDFAGTVADITVAVLSPGVVLVTYRIEGTRPSLRSSVWTLTDNRWRLRFHQGTLAPALHQGQ